MGLVTLVACSPCSPNNITSTIMFQCYCLVIASTELCELVLSQILFISQMKLSALYMYVAAICRPPNDWSASRDENTWAKVFWRRLDRSLPGDRRHQSNSAHTSPEGSNILDCFVCTLHRDTSEFLCVEKVACAISEKRHWSKNWKRKHLKHITMYPWIGIR